MFLKTMNRLTSAILLTCLIFASESLIQPDNEPPTTKPNESEQKVTELQRRKVIAENYMNTLASAKETWVDPYEMISYPVKEERQEFSKSTEESTIKSTYNLNSDEEPLFSDIKGEVIGSKISKVDDIDDNVIVSGGHFSKDRQQICVLDSIYIARWLKKLVSKVEKESNSEPSSLTFALDESMLNNLKELSTAKSLEIAQLDELICSMLAQATVSKKEEFDWSVMFVYAKYVGWAAGFSLFIYILYMCSRYHPIVTCIIIFCGIVVFWHWMHLYQQRIAFKHAELSSMTVPNECRKHEFGIYEHFQEYIKSFFKNNECVKYHEALLVDPMWEVSISVAATEAVAATVLQPLSVVSRVVNSFLKQLFDGLPLEAKVPLIVLIFLLLIMRCNYRIRFPFFMGGIEPHYPVGTCVENLQPRKTLSASSKKKVSKIVQCIPGKNSKPLRNQQDVNMDGNLLSILQNKPSKCTKHSARPIGVNWRLNNCLADCSKSESFEDNESGNDSEEFDSGTEKAAELVMQCEHGSCYLSSDDVQYLHKDCRVCSREESRNAVMIDEDDAKSGSVSGQLNCSVAKDSIDDNCVCANASALNRTSQAVSERGLCRDGHQ